MRSDHTCKVWRKLHIAIDDQGEIIAHELTNHTTSDCSQVKGLLNQIESPIETVIGDGGDDPPATYQAIEDHPNLCNNKPPTIIIPPNTSFQAIQDFNPNQRKQNQNIIDQKGRQAWQP